MLVGAMGFVFLVFYIHKYLLNEWIWVHKCCIIPIVGEIINV